MKGRGGEIVSEENHRGIALQEQTQHGFTLQGGREESSIL